MPIRQALARAAITSLLLVALTAVALFAVASRLPDDEGLKLLRGAAVEGQSLTGDDLGERPTICLMTDCVKTADPSMFCFVRRERLSDSGTDCARPLLRIRLTPTFSHWPMRPGAPL